jgi:hypothetical protein
MITWSRQSRRSDPIPHFPCERRAAAETGPALAHPVAFEPPAAPTNHGGRMDDGQRLLPPNPDPGEPSPEAAVDRAQAQSSLAHGALEHADLVTQGQVLDCQIALRADERADGAEQASQHSHHGLGEATSRARNPQAFRCGWVFGSDRQVPNVLVRSSAGMLSNLLECAAAGSLSAEWA